MDKTEKIQKISSSIPKDRAMKIIKNVIISLSVATVLILGFVIWSWFSISIDSAQAVNIALERTGGGTAIGPDLGFEIWVGGAGFAWDVEVMFENIMHSIYVDARTGRVVYHDSWWR
ncbi:MAG: hypothetical protein FWF57_02065 [Defluviitaleaceae bacterium]|nr:hypothetical protein [Defluviitaleaceae bacterium]